MKDTLKVGASAEIEIATTPEMGITHLGHDAPRMYSTPSMISLMEQTAIRVLTPHLDAGEQSVGTKVSVSHFKATPIGQKVRAKATLTEIVDIGRPTNSTVLEQSFVYVQWNQYVTLFPVIETGKLIAL